MNADKQTYQKVIKVEVSKDLKDFDYPDVFLKEIHTILKVTKEICERENINYFIDGGTLLGCVRDNGQIPYDNDADLGMFKKDFNKIIKFQDEYEKEGYYMFVEGDKCRILSGKVYIKQDEKQDDNFRIVPGVDILVYEIINENNINKVVIKDENYKREYPYAFHYLKHLLPMKEYKYSCPSCDEILILKGPNNPKNYLDGTYPEWNTKRIYDHKTYFVN